MKEVLVLLSLICLVSCSKTESVQGKELTQAKLNEEKKMFRKNSTSKPNALSHKKSIFLRIPFVSSLFLILVGLNICMTQTTIDVYVVYSLNTSHERINIDKAIADQKTIWFSQSCQKL